VAVADVTVATFEEMEPIYEGLARRGTGDPRCQRVGDAADDAASELGRVPNHRHDWESLDPNQEEVYAPIEGSGVLHAEGETFELRPGMMARVGPEQLRRIVPGDEGIRFIALGGSPGSFEASAWTEVGGPPPVPPESE
jgi:mannose-6-phosphate isomerase-like protein (cupin superfamily)